MSNPGVLVTRRIPSAVVARLEEACAVELYSGDATTANADSILASVTPKAESELGAPNNRAGNRQFFPNVVSF